MTARNAGGRRGRGLAAALPGSVVSAREYPASAEASARGVRVYNLRRSYRYQKSGYYVSLLAAARGHRPFPAS